MDTIKESEEMDEDEKSSMIVEKDELIFSQKVDNSNLEVTVAGVITDDESLMDYLNYLVKNHIKELQQGPSST